MSLILTKLKIEKAKESDWKEILVLMEETGRKSFFTGIESYKKFYLVRDTETKEVICSFAIDTENTTAILKFLGVRKDLQKKGVAKYVISKVPDILKEQGIKWLYASTWDAPGFWAKTVFKEIKINDVKDPFFLKYLSELEKGFPYEYSNLLKNYFVKIK